MHVHGSEVNVLWDRDVGSCYDFDTVVEFNHDDLDVRGFLNVEYRTWVNVFEQEFPEGELYDPEPDKYL